MGTWRVLVLGSALLSVIAACDRRADALLLPLRFHHFDHDGNREISPQEFLDGLAVMGLFRDWDRDGDGGLTEGELAAALHAAWDRNRDGLVDVIEYKRGTALWMPAPMRYDYQRFRDWDCDGDGKLSEAELRHGLRVTNLFASLDSDNDGLLSDQELGLGVFRGWDLNGNGSLDMYEWRWM